MRQNSLLAGVGIVVFFLILIAGLPARVVTNQLSGNIRTAGVAGTLFSGRVHSISFDQWQLRDTRWELNPAALMLGRLSANIVTHFAGSKITAQTSVSLTGKIAIRDLEAAGLIAPLAARLNQFVTGGRYQIQLSALDITDAWPTTLAGSVLVTGVPINIMAGGSGPTGSYTVVFDVDSVPEDGRLSGALSDDGGPLEVGGNIILAPPANYVIQAKLKARPNAPAEIAQVLSLAGPVGRDGNREISLAGSL